MCGRGQKYYPVVVHRRDTRAVFIQLSDANDLLGGAETGVMLSDECIFSLPVLCGRVAIGLSAARWSQLGCVQGASEMADGEGDGMVAARGRLMLAEEGPYTYRSS